MSDISEKAKEDSEVIKAKAIKAKILYVHYGDNWIRGSEVVLLDLLKSAKDNNYSPVLWCNSEVLAKEALALGIDVITDNFVCLGYWTTPRWNFLQFFKLLLKAKKLIKDHDISLVHCNNGAPCQWMVPVCKFTGTPLLLHLHARYMYRDRLTLLFNGADSIVGVSQCVTDIFKRDEFNQFKGVNGPRVSVIYNGIDPNRVICESPRDIRAELGASKNDFVMLYMGSLITRKSVDTVLVAIAELQKKYNVKLAIVGSGCEDGNLAELVNELTLQSSVKFFSPTDKVAEFYSSNADCFISVPSEEVFGLTLAEASLAKLPIITCNIPGINEIYTHKKNAMLISPTLTENNDGCEELVNAISTLIDKPMLRKTLAENAQKHIEEAFSLKQQFIVFNETYQRLLQNETKSSITQMVALQAKILTQAFLRKFLVNRAANKADNNGVNKAVKHVFNKLTGSRAITHYHK